VNERSGQPEPVGSPDKKGLGALSGERYTLGEEIARGGMGRVVDATDTVLGRIVAFKEALSEDAEALRRFAREIRITARLEHPSIVPVHDAGTTATGSPFYVMRKVSGRPLEDLVVEADTLAARLALVPHVLAAAQAIAHAHERGVLHRDLKPSNILVGSLGETVVIDWGLAKVIGEPDDPDEPAVIAPISAGDSLRTRIGTVFGTPGFMSPEQLRGETVDAKSDVYALGATLYYVLARRPPHAARTGDDMMAAALVGPPQAIGELAPGVAPELVTIVDTALAHDDRRRYPSAAAFVADLQRFLTGQLVASHRYSRRERMRRFLRRHKLPVAIGALALLAIAIVATLAIRRVITERNRADSALAEALDRNEQLIVTQAQTLLVSNPTAAVATAKSLGRERWREARAIGLAARATGVARGYPASARTTMLELTVDGKRAISAGTDGVIREHDLVRHTTRELVRIAPGRGTELLDGDRRIVAWDSEHAEVVDLATGAHRPLSLPATAIGNVFSHGTTVWVTGDDGSVFVGQLDDPALRRVPIDDVRTVAPSPDGSWVAYGGAALWLQHGDEPPVKIADGLTNLIDWADDGKRLAAYVQRRSLEVTLTNNRPAITQDHAGELALSIAAVRDGVYTGHIGIVHKTMQANPNGFGIRIEGGAISRLHHGFHGSLLAVSGLGPINVIGDQVTFTISPPTTVLTTSDAAPSSPFVIAATDGAVLAWDLAPMIPELLPVERPIGYALVGDHQLITHYVEKPGEWHDFVKHDVTQVDIGILPLRIVGADRGDLMVLASSEGTFMFRRGVPGSVQLDVAIRLAYFTAADDLLVASNDGAIQIYAPPAYQRQTLFEHAGEVISLASQLVDGTWVSATYADGTIWRYDLRARTSTSIAMRAPLSWSFVVPGGDVFFAEDQQLKRWRTDNSVNIHAVLPRTIRNAYLLDANHVLVLTDDNAGYEVRLDTAGAVTSRFAPGTRVGSAGLTADIALTLDNSGAVLATDPLTGVRWTHARSSRAPLSNAMMSRDGKYAFALATDGILRWRLELPRTPEETRAFLDALTNARSPTGPVALTWE
jgi:WD40 repeat protein